MTSADAEMQQKEMQPAEESKEIQAHVSDEEMEVESSDDAQDEARRQSSTHMIRPSRVSCNTRRSCIVSDDDDLAQDLPCHCLHKSCYLTFTNKKAHRRIHKNLATWFVYCLGNGCQFCTHEK